MQPEIMLDLETMDAAPTAAIVAIGAVRFNDTGITDEFYISIDLESARRGGGTMSASTILWWIGQSEDARNELLYSPKVDIGKALLEFTKFCPDQCLVWGNGASFDNVVLRTAYERCMFPTPWNFRNDRCYRTLASMAPNALKVESQVPHHALHDARAQAQTLINIREAYGRPFTQINDK